MTDGDEFVLERARLLAMKVEANMRALFGAAMTKMSLTGQDKSKLVDCTEAIPCESKSAKLRIVFVLIICVSP